MNNVVFTFCFYPRNRRSVCTLTSYKMKISHISFTLIWVSKGVSPFLSHSYGFSIKSFIVSTFARCSHGALEASYSELINRILQRIVKRESHRFNKIVLTTKVTKAVLKASVSSISAWRIVERYWIVSNVSKKSARGFQHISSHP